MEGCLKYSSNYHYVYVLKHKNEKYYNDNEDDILQTIIMLMYYKDEKYYNDINIILLTIIMFGVVTVRPITFHPITFHPKRFT